MDQMAAIDFGLPTLVLMENAGQQCARALLRRDPELGRDPQFGRVVILAGKGNNGGDGMVMARHLDGLGVDVRLVTWWDAPQMSPDAATNWAALQRSDIDCISLGAEASAQEIAKQLLRFIC